MEASPRGRLSVPEKPNKSTASSPVGEPIPLAKSMLRRLARRLLASKGPGTLLP